MESRDTITLTASGPLRGEVEPPPDKSISHRALIFASIVNGTSRIKNLLRAADPLSTMNAMRSLGIEIRDSGDEITVYGRGLHGLQEPEDIVDCGNSGTTMRLLTGLLSGQPFFSVLTGDSSLRRRPMKRVITPMHQMGAIIHARENDSLAPIAIKGGKLKGIEYTSAVSSAQVKSAILLAGLYAEGETSVLEPRKSRDHTERMLPALGAQLRIEGLKVTVKGGTELNAFEITVPGDFSSAAFFMVAGTIVKGSEILITNVGINPTRTGLLEIMKRMGADVQLIKQREVSGEPVADILARYSETLKAVEIGPDEVPAMIDEFPIFTILATQAEGTTVIRGAEELRVKESDRIATMAAELRKMSVQVEEFHDGLAIQGPVKLNGATLESHGDHRVAMALSVASLIAEGSTEIKGISSVEISFPGFYNQLKGLMSA